MSSTTRASIRFARTETFFHQHVFSIDQLTGGHMRKQFQSRPMPALSTAVLLLLSALGAWWLFPFPQTPLALMVAATFFLLAMRSPFFAVLTFVSVSLFRLPDAFPSLQVLQLPAFAGGMVVAALLWHLAIGKMPRDPVPLVLALFAAFFLLVTLGLPFAANRAAAYDTWTGVYAKIAVMTLAIAWLANTPADFLNSSRVFICCGAAISLVALGNWASDKISSKELALPSAMDRTPC